MPPWPIFETIPSLLPIQGNSCISQLSILLNAYMYSTLSISHSFKNKIIKCIKCITQDKKSLHVIILEPVLDEVIHAYQHCTCKDIVNHFIFKCSLFRNFLIVHIRRDLNLQCMTL